MGLVDASWAVSARTLWVHKPYNVSMRIIHVREEKKTKKFTMHIEQPGFIVTIIQKINSIYLLAN